MRWMTWIAICQTIGSGGNVFFPQAPGATLRVETLVLSAPPGTALHILSAM
jgi:hypothetical protein